MQLVDNVEEENSDLVCHLVWGKGTKMSALRESIHHHQNGGKAV